MNDWIRSLMGLLVLAVLALAGFVLIGIADLKWPWSNPAGFDQTTTVSQPAEAEIVDIEPIALDCRARIHTVVPVFGKREHEALGGVYRTDTVEMTAVGDIDTCVDATEVEIVVRADGSARVLVPADAIEFVRPRVDAVATLDSVTFDQGLIGKVTDIFPWVSDNSGLTPAAFAYAQRVIGSSACMQEAYDTTTRAMTEAYEEQMRSAGLDPDKLEIDIVGEPDFGDLPDPDDTGGFDFEVEGEGTSCSVSPGAYEGDQIILETR